MTIKSKEQTALFNPINDYELMDYILSMPKIDLHRHLTGSISPRIAIKIASKYKKSLASFIESELRKVLVISSPVKTHQEYFSTWHDLNKLFISYDSTFDIITSVAKEAREDNVVYMELRMGPRGFLGEDKTDLDNKTFFKAINDGIKFSEEKYGIYIRALLGIPRHIFGRIKDNLKRSVFFSRLIELISELIPDCFVGIDLNGDEKKYDSSHFKVFFDSAKERGIKITVHAGELGDTNNVYKAILEVGANRIGHGLAAAKDSTLMEMLSERKCVLELSPTSNQKLSIIRNIIELPILSFNNKKVKYAICTDNPGRCGTTLSEELYKVAQAFDFNYRELLDLQYSALSGSFAKKELKESIYKIISNFNKL